MKSPDGRSWWREFTTYDSVVRGSSQTSRWLPPPAAAPGWTPGRLARPKEGLQIAYEAVEMARDEVGDNPYSRVFPVVDGLMQNRVTPGR